MGLREEEASAKQQEQLRVLLTRRDRSDGRRAEKGIGERTVSGVKSRGERDDEKQRDIVADAGKGKTRK